MIIEESTDNMYPLEASVLEPFATEEIAAAAEARAQPDASAGNDSSTVRPRAFRRAPGEKDAPLRGRGFSRSGSVRFARHTSSGGSSGFYRDAGYLGEDHWQSVSASLPDLAPRLPAQWTGGNAKLSEPSQPLTPTTLARGPLAAQASHGNIGGGSSGVTADARVGSNRSVLGSSRSGRGAISISSRGSMGNSVGSSLRGGRSFSTSAELIGGNDQPGASSSAGGAAAAAASALLYGVGGSKRRSGSSRQSIFAIGREGSAAAWSSTGHGLGAGTIPAIPPNKGSSSRLASFKRRESINGAPRLQLSDHGVRVPRVVFSLGSFLPNTEAHVMDQPRW